MADDVVTEWLLQTDPSVRWQVMRDVLGSPRVEWQPERSKVETGGWGRQLLSYRDDDGQWDGGSFLPRGFTADEWHNVGQPWTATTWALTQLREFGLDPSSATARRTAELVRANSRWDHDGQPYWEGEVEECINGRTVADGAYFGVDVTAIVDRLLGESQADGGWNCERVNGSLRSSFHTTINVLEGLIEFEKRTGGTAASRAARAAGEEYLLERELFRRLSSGEPADDRFLLFLYPNRWRYDVLRGLDYFRASAVETGVRPDPRLQGAVEHLRSRRRPDGRWDLDWKLAGRAWADFGAVPGEPSPWITLRALRVLRWWDEGSR